MPAGPHGTRTPGSPPRGLPDPPPRGAASPVRAAGKGSGSA